MDTKNVVIMTTRMVELERTLYNYGTEKWYLKINQSVGCSIIFLDKQ